MTALPAQTVLPRCVAIGSALVLPSLYVVHKFLGNTAVLGYVLGAVALVTIFSCTRGPRSERTTLVLSLVTVALVIAVFVLLYPIANTHAPLTGSDDDDAHDLGAHALLALRTPYAEHTYLGNVLHQLPGSFLLAAPFALLGASALQNLFWLATFFWCVKVETKDSAFALRLSWLVLLGDPSVLHQVATGTGHGANTLFVLLGLWWLSRTRRLELAAAAWGVTLASRVNFWLLVPLAFGWLYQQHGQRVAARTIAIAAVVCAALSLPFYFADPAHFGPLEASDRLQRFDALFPHAGVFVGLLMAALALGLSATSMTRAALFRNCALVQAVPIAAELLRSVATWDGVDLEYLSYSTFFAWFVFMAYASGDTQRSVTDTASSATS